MSQTIKVYNHFEMLLVTGQIVKGGSRDTPVELTVDGIVYEAQATVVSAVDPDDATLEKLWETGYGNLDTFKFLFFESDADVLLMLRNDNATDQYAVIAVEANIPVMLAADDLIGNDDATAPCIDGTITTPDQIDEISVQNNVAVESTANVRLVLID